jgi:ABC-2 type transport system permease protein
MKVIFINSIRTALRQKYLQVLAAILLLLFALVAFNSVIAYKARLQSFERAKQVVRTAWLSQGPQNPHSSAHYGHYIFQPVTAMHFLDNGIRPFAGSILRLEAHTQNEAAFSPAQDKTELSRFGDMGFAWILQVLMPLFIILLCFNTVCADRENQNLKLLAAQGLSNHHYLWGKVLAMYSLVLALSLTGLVIQLAAYGLFAKGASPIAIGQASVWASLYAVYLFAITGISVLVSAWLQQGRSSLLIQLAAWITLMLVLPKITASAGANLHPLEHKAVFTQALRADREKGIDGHNPEDERAKKFMDSVVAHYKIDTNKVDDINEALPVNVDGLVMQADEEYANLVYDKHFTRIRETIGKQNSISKYVSLLNPYLAIRNISMDVSQSGFNSHLNLLADAETYRRYLIKTLNDKMAYGGSKTGDWDWKVDAKYWETVKDFTYPAATLAQSLQQSKTELLALGIWLLLIISAISITAKKLKVL